jgi:hypothetical protein
VCSLGGGIFPFFGNAARSNQLPLTYKPLNQARERAMSEQPHSMMTIFITAVLVMVVMIAAWTVWTLLAPLVRS